MEKTIKYLENGEYHYATVKDVGDLAKLKTDSKDDLVAAINDLFENGGENAGKPEGYDNLVNNVADAIQKQQQMSSTITNMQQSAQLSDAEMEHMKQVQEELHQEYLKAIKELNEAVDKAKADAAALDKKTNDMQDKIDETFADVNKEVSDVHKQLDAEAKGLHKDLDETKTNLEATRKDLLNSTQEYGQVHSDVQELQDKFSRRVWSTDLDPVREQVSKNSTEVQQTKDELKNKADQSNLDLVTNSVENLSAQVKQNASGLEVAVKRDELGGDVSRLLNDKTNLLLGTRNFAGDKWSNLDHWHEEPGYWNGLKVYSSTSDWYGIQYQYEVKKGNQYTFSFYARQQSENNSAYIMLSEGSTGSQRACTEPYQKSDTHIGTEWKRYSLTFQAIADGTIYPRVEQSVTNNTIYVAGYKLELGKNATPWEPNEADIAENIEHTESQFNVYSDQIAGIVKKQEKMGDTERQLDTRITETAEGLKQTSKDLQDANGKITEFKGQLESTARGLKTEYEKYTNDAVGQISDSTLNLIRNSSFQNKDSDFDQWQNISAKANVRSDENGLRWVELTQSGLTTDNPQGLTSNYFNVKQGKVTIAVDIKAGDKASLDNESVLFLELYNDAKKRVDFRFVTLSELGLSKNLLDDHKVHRGLYRLGIDRNDAKYMTVKAHLMRNGDLYFTNFSARLSSIDDGAYEPNPDDINQQILKQNTKIEQNAKEVAIKANSVDVTRDINSAVDGIQVGGVNLLKNSAGPFQPKSDSGIDNYQWFNSVTIDMIQGQQYTVSGATNGNFSDYHDPSTESDRCVLWLCHYDRGVNQIISSNTTNHGTTFIWNYPTDTYTLRVNTYHPTEKNQIKAWNIKIESGNKKTDWAPAPEDTSAEIKSAKEAAIKVASDQINIHVNELTTSFDDKLNKRINEQKTASEKFTSDGIEQVVTKVTNVKNDVDRLGDNLRNTGTRNLLHNTSDQWRTLTNDGAWLQKTTASTNMTSVANYHSGDQFTYAATVNNTSSQSVQLEIQQFDQNYNEIVGTQSSPIPVGTKNYRASMNVQLDENTRFVSTWLIFQGGNGAQGEQIQVKDERLVEGVAPGSWSPNPDDINQQITNTNKKIDTQTLDSANIDNMRTQGHYFVRNLTGNPIGGWVYVDVTGNNNDRIRQDVYQDNGSKHMYRRLFGSSWSDWEQGAYLSDVSSLKTEVTASVKNLGDRVTTQVNSVETRMSDQIANAVELIQKSDFSDGSKGSWTVQGIVSANNPAPPAELGISGMKVIQSNVRDSYEDIWHSVTPGEKFNVDFWCAPSGVYDSSFGLIFYDANKKLVSNNQWLGVRTDHSGQWKHYTGEITAPDNSAFAKPWFQIDMPADHYNTSWLAKPHIRRQDPRVTEAIKEINTKWDVANGQIQGKVTATEVNNILNGKGYATQSWAQTKFQMKSDSITLQAVRDNITNGIQNQVNSIQGKLEGDLSNICRNPTFSHGVEGWNSSHLAVEGPWSEMPTPKNGTLFVRDAYYGDYFPVSKGERYYTSVFAHNGDSATFVLGLCFQLKDGSLSWLSGSNVPGLQTGKFDGYVDVPDNAVSAKIWASIQKFDNFGWVRFTNVVVKKNDAISQINLSPDNIRLSSKKIEIDGNTYIHGDLNVQTVKLKGNNGTIDLTGDGIHIGGSKGDIKLDSSGIDITKNGQGLSITGDYIQVVTDSNGQKEITGLIGSNFNLKNKNQNGLALLVTPQQELGRPYGGDLLTIGELEKSGEVTSAVTFDATNITGDGAGFHWTAPHYLHGPAQAIHITETQDNLTLLPLKMPHSSQENYYQPALTVTHGIDGNGNYVHGDSGVEFLWNSIKPYGSVDMTDARLWVYGVDHGIKNVWVSWSNWDGGERYPALVNDIGYWGGIAFPKSGRVTLFDADGRYYCPDKSTGLGAYDNYMGKDNNWH